MTTRNLTPSRSTPGDSSPSACVVLDTNVWVSNPSLNTPIGVALLYALRRLNRTIGLPEVIELELTKHTTRLAVEALQAIAKGYGMIGTIMGSRDDYKVPSETEVRERLALVLKEHDQILTRVAFTVEHARGALDRVLSELPPNGPKNQQFKDSAIWEVILELARSMDVDLVTDDKQFFDNRDTTKGLARNLRIEAAQQPHHIRVFGGLKAYLASLEEKVPAVDPLPVISAIQDAVMPELHAHAESKQFELGARIRESVEAFVTERSTFLALSYEITFQAFDRTESVEEHGTPDTVTASGSVFYDYVTGEFSELQPGAIQYRRATGEMVGRNCINYGWVAGISGRHAVPTRIRVPVQVKSSLPPAVT